MQERIKRGTFWLEAFVSGAWRTRGEHLP